MTVNVRLLPSRLEEAEHHARKLADLLPEVAELAYAPSGQDYDADRVTGTKNRKKPPPTEDRESANIYRESCRDLARADLTLARSVPGYQPWASSREVANGHLSLNVSQAAWLARRVAAAFRVGREAFRYQPQRFRPPSQRALQRATDLVWRAYAPVKPYGGVAPELQRSTHDPARRRRDLEKV